MRRVAGCGTLFWLTLAMAACTSGSDDADTDTDTDVVDTGETGGEDSDEVVDSDTDVADTDETDTGPTGPYFADEDWVDGWDEVVSVNTSANAGRGEVTIRLLTAQGGQYVALYLANMTASPRSDEHHTLAAAQAPSADRNAWQRVFDCDESEGTSSTAYRCDNSRDTFSRDSAFLAVGLAAGVWKVKPVGDDPPAGPPDDCIVFGKNPQLLRDETPLPGLTPPSWVGPDCREVEAGGE